jgi:hypothetical protein
MLKRDSLALGIVLGLLAPLIGGGLYYVMAFADQITFTEFLSLLKRYSKLLTGVSSIALVANALVFTLFINRHQDKTAKGVFVATLLYGIVVILIKFLG